MENNKEAITAFEDNKKLSNQLGYYIGEYIVFNFLPTLSCDFETARNTIKITEDEQRKYTEIQQKWYMKTLKRENGKEVSSEEEWNEYLKFRKELTKKYVPDILECHIPVLEENGLDIDLFKQGIGVALWDSDISHYSCDPKNIAVEFRSGDFSFPCITLIRSDD